MAIEYEGYKVLRSLGEGSFGSTYLVEKEGQEFCMKKIPIPKKSKQAEILKEVSILQRLKHPFIVGYINNFVLNGYLYIIMEYANQGDLGTFLKKCQQDNTPILQETIILWFSQLCAAIKYVHDHKIIHRDIKPKNIVLHDYQVKLADFGAGKFLDLHQQTNTTIGTVLYMSPEICNREDYDHSTDLWSLGVVLYELLNLYNPFGDSKRSEDNKIIWERVKKGILKRPNNQYNEDLNRITTSLLNVAPKHRSSIESILNNRIIFTIVEKTEGFIELLATKLKIENLKDTNGPLYKIKQEWVEKRNQEKEKERLQEQQRLELEKVNEKQDIYGLFKRVEKSIVKLDQINYEMEKELLSKQLSSPPTQWVINEKVKSRLSINLKDNPINSWAFEVELIRSKLEIVPSDIRIQSFGKIDQYVNGRIAKLIFFIASMMRGSDLIGFGRSWILGSSKDKETAVHIFSVNEDSFVIDSLENASNCTKTSWFFGRIGSKLST
ncbi:putative protein serine/threonine kinase [Cavenderia fasciculata]|uniref:non-specific serine/threonine protein kinase n=1 Tax=Cavenderia fasciculata TaxID=261658 RepID=F4QF70_CACFS|nr:putative protein serine/threonine kinase [Cavenderia fasciculata]EGG14224.1 putative protein serine/threonine kinase [Cavenderia fasciculata]|eukprot:XP_004350932.1 putative protein serine/threonine kinase [Cavenderia fasciculata]